MKITLPNLIIILINFLKINKNVYKNAVHIYYV